MAMANVNNTSKIDVKEYDDDRTMTDSRVESLGNSQEVRPPRSPSPVAIVKPRGPPPRPSSSPKVRPIFDRPIQLPDRFQIQSEQRCGSPNRRNAAAPRRISSFYPSNSTSEYGKGFVLIIANFAEELVGYKKDIDDITQFFKNTLHYEVFGGSDENTQSSLYRDLSKEATRNTLKDARQYLNSRFNQIPYDRLFLFILSHGDEQGVMTCKKLTSGKVVPETNGSGSQVYITPEEITRFFYHDRMPALMGMPKCVFIQACLGKQKLQAASDSYASPHTNLRALGADFAVFYATSPGHQSYVHSSEGSLFIQETITALNDFYETEHLEDIMTEVRKKLAQRSNEEPVGDDQGQHLFQLPATFNLLTERLYFKIPK